MSFWGATGTPVLDFWWHLPWVSKPEWILPYLLFCGGECNVHSPRSTSGATCADLLVVGSTASHFPTCISRCGIWLRFEWTITRSEDQRAVVSLVQLKTFTFTPITLCGPFMCSYCSILRIKLNAKSDPENNYSGKLVLKKESSKNYFSALKRLKSDGEQ